MSFFLELPNEVLDLIIDETSAGDITSLALSHRRLNNRAQIRLAFHRRKRARVRDVVMGSLQWGPSPCYHPLAYLEQILQNEDIRFYMRVMIIGVLGPETYADDEKEDLEGLNKEHFSSLKSQYERQISAHLAAIRNALLPYATETAIQRWIDLVLRGKTVAVVILLLALYPNLAVLHVQDPILRWVNLDMSMEEKASEGSACGTIFRSLIAAAMVPGTNKLKVFSRLSDFEWIYVYGVKGVKANAAIVPRFMALPTMRKIIFRGIDGRNVSWPHDEKTSGVTHLELEGDIDRASLSNVIGGLKKLEVFRYQFTPIGVDARSIGEGLNRPKWGPRAASDAAMNEPDQENSDQDSRDAEEPAGEIFDEDNVVRPCWEPRAITAVLMQYAGSSLVSLDLTATSFEGVNRLSCEEPFIGSLRSFLVLKNVRIDTMMLFERVKRPRNVSATGGNSLRGNLLEEIRAQSLVEFLPKTIETLSMTCWFVGNGFSKGDVEAMFAGLPTQMYKLPQFSMMRFQWASVWDSRRDSNLIAEKEGWEEWLLRCQQNEIELSYSVDGGHP